MIYEVKELYSDSEGVQRYYDTYEKALERVNFRIDVLKESLYAPIVRNISLDKLQHPVKQSTIIHYQSGDKPEFIALQVSEYELE